MYKHLRAVIGIITRLRKIVPGEDSAIYSVRGHHSGYFGLRETVELYQPQSWATIAE